MADVVIIGFGAAGACAALEARENGASVVIIDRFSGGGATARSGGVVYAGGTEQQREAGFFDSSENMLEYLRAEVSDAVSDEALQDFCARSAGNLRWLEDHGVRFSSSLFEGKTSYPPEGKFLYFSGNERTAQFRDVAAPMPRGHRTYGEGWTGAALFSGLASAVQAREIPVLAHTVAKDLVCDDGGRVVGVEAVCVDASQWASHQRLADAVNPWRAFGFAKAERLRKRAEALELKGRRKRIQAKNGVVIAAGGFGYNQQMIERWLPHLSASTRNFLRLGTLGCNGSGIQLAQSVGASLGKMDRAYVGRNLAPPFDLLKGALVNKAGERFINEDACNAYIGQAIAEQPDGAAFLILSQGMFWSALKGLQPRDSNFLPYSAPKLLNIVFGGTKTAANIPALASKSGIDPDRLDETISQYDRIGVSNEDDPWQKDPAYCQQIGSGRCFAIDFSIGNKFSFMPFFTLGGICVADKSGLAISSTGDTIPGLYAAGRSAVGVCSNNYSCSGLSLADCVYSGRRAGRHCALEGA